MKTLVFLLLVLTQWTRAAPVKDDGDSSLMYRCNCGSPVQPIPPAVIPVPHPSHIDIPPNWHPGPSFWYPHPHSLLPIPHPPVIAPVPLPHPLPHPHPPVIAPVPLPHPLPPPPPPPPSRTRCVCTYD
ncbi:uncharacterized protein LOC129972963 [Argiope bruennichi]|uniref:uncharacterized protein LOC129972963 n=1 Tax=Argiope bruennichi TaxID=94029 RepID=UPI0024954907|nr:uncharacterized protein LOC129972963 [Argiope bruennichi]